MIIAVIDIGTNSTRLLVAGRDGSGILTVLARELITTRLGQGLGRGMLQQEAMERTLEALGTFKERAGSWGADRIVAVATSAVRDAVNSPAFVEAVRRRTGIKVRVLPGVQEARYSYYGVLGGLPNCPKDALVIDIGGGSTEFIWAMDGVMHCRSVQAGAVRMTEGEHSDRELAEVLHPVLVEIQTGSLPSCLVGVGGTVTTLAAMDRKMLVYEPAVVHGSIITLAKVEELLDLLQGCDLQSRKQIPGLQAPRADIIIAGVRIVRVIMTGLNLPRLMVSETDILYGVTMEESNKI
jgi:exopolyphosphatase/guanosine-5'-triphosphate,3'-diphosphate pyrophosphatase